MHLPEDGVTKSSINFPIVLCITIMYIGMYTLNTVSLNSFTFSLTQLLSLLSSVCLSFYSIITLVQRVVLSWSPI